MNAVSNMPLSPELPAAGSKPAGLGESPRGRSSNSEPADFKSALREVNARERSDGNPNASPTEERTQTEGGDNPDLGKDDPSVAETSSENTGPFVAEDDRPRLGTGTRLVGHVEPTVENATTAPPSEKVVNAALPHQSGLQNGKPSRPATGPEPKTWPSSASATVAAPDSDGVRFDPQGKQAPSPTMGKPVAPQGAASEPRASSVQGRMAAVEMDPLPDDWTSRKPATGDSVLTDKAVNPAKAAAESVREGTRPPTASRVQTAASDPPKTSETEGRIKADMPRAETEGVEGSSSRSISNAMPAAAQRMMPAAQSKVEQRTDGLGAIERGNGHLIDKATQAPGAEKAPPPSPEGFRENNLASIVERIAVTVRGSQSEARMALKPENLGNLRVQISTENNMVSIKIMTEFSMARDLLESNLPQLKAELQQQGLDVEEFDVSLEDEKQPFRREERRARGNRQGGHANGRPVEEDERAKDGRGQETRRASVDRTPGIDYFA